MIMEETKVRERAAQLKKIGKIARIVSLVAAIVVAVLFVLFCLMPATNLKTDSGKYINGYNYYGWQLIFLGCGYPPVPILYLFEPAGSAAGDFVPGTYDFGFNVITFLGLIIPIIAIVVCSILYGKQKNRGKAICEFVMAGSVLFGGIVLVCCGVLSTTVATDLGAGVGFKKQYLMPAIEAGTYKTLAYPIILFVISLFTALIKAANGAFLLYQKSYVSKNRTVLTGN